MKSVFISERALGIKRAWSSWFDQYTKRKNLNKQHDTANISSFFQFLWTGDTGNTLNVLGGRIYGSLQSS